MLSQGLRILSINFWMNEPVFMELGIYDYVMAPSPSQWLFDKSLSCASPYHWQAKARKERYRGNEY
jgi:hypothetical protein